jgi:hypothetical protein
VWRGGASVQSFGTIDCKLFSKRFLFSLILIPVLAFLTLCGFTGPAVADGDAVLRESAQKLAERIVGIPGLRGPVRFAWHPDANWSEGESAHWRELLKAELERRSLNLTEDAGVPELEVFAAETPTQVVLTAKTRISDREEIRIVAVGRAMLPAGSLPVAPVRLERQLIYQSTDRILHASSFVNSQEDGLALLLYRNFEIVAVRIDSRGAVKQSVSLNTANLKPSRDPRAELTTHGSVVSVALPGKACEFSWEAPGEVKCRAEKPAATEESGWRSDTLLASPCDGSRWKLLRSGSEPNARDVLQVVRDGAMQESRAAVLSEFPGPILGTNGEQNSRSAMVITRNLRTGSYEIYKIALACGN